MWSRETVPFSICCVRIPAFHCSDWVFLQVYTQCAAVFWTCKLATIRQQHTHFAVTASTQVQPAFWLPSTDKLVDSLLLLTPGGFCGLQMQQMQKGSA